ncbi:MAG: IS30 family transposase [Candidatus Omnitrophica bacterium CG08_land_8_20_14_0_20_41_16]|uniref:IS30 family transposase n=1 Tax=Candidatus Sherwoodlollariibacterium unditelluris TaxID=1974757 RepID=A0A2G9YL76_9BACT|nr:MAG: IS30 family transposase [Candidatus Omnitrophica bacterium CG23_combo_of_CG06-09_8_20_14_all_41_10]PIS33362.1 MAG: IS30 family transposase [Candidatus Omnitrophica bacterium CG08_land_8_20_14_0_20_41_16]
MPQYHRLNVNEREEISLGLAQGRSRRDIALALDRYPSTISREIKRNNNHASCYRAVESQERADDQVHNTIRKTQKLETNKPLKQVVLCYLNQLWSPEQIAKRLKMLYPSDMAMRVSHETIYQYLYVLPRGELRRELTRCLRRHHTHRRTKNKVRRQSCPIQDFISIEERPAEVADRIVPGHWEGDLLSGHDNKSALGTLVERTTRMTFLVPIKNKDAMSVRRAFARQFKTIPDGLKRTLTYDHGQEMAQHKLFTKNTRIQVYFAHPHSPWERGTNENTNSLIRQFFPKGTNFSNIPNKAIKKAQDMLNDRPRKTLQFYTPHEVFNKLLSVALVT